MSIRLRSSARASTAASTAATDSNTKLIKDPTATKMEQTTTTKRSTSSRSTRSITPSVVDMKKIKLIAYFAAIAGISFCGAIFYLVYNDTLVLYPRRYSASNFPGFASRAEYALRYQSLLLFWLSFNIHAVILTRLRNGALNPLIESTEKKVQLIKNVLTNSFEHIFLSFFAQLTFVSFADPAHVLKFIPAINIVQLIGRIFFLLGYPYYRTFGFFLTSLPNTCLIGYNLYQFGSFVYLY